MEGVASVYAVNKDPELDKLMDNFIACVVKAQRADGYIHTPVVIEELNKGIDSHTLADSQQQTVIGTKVGAEDEKGAFANRLNFETYNLGHLMMAGIVHRRATGKTTLFDAAVKATDFLCHFYETASAELARNAICPSHYMGVVEMYRATKNPRYLELSKNLINIRGMVENGTDDNQDRIPFRDQYRAMGHAVRANYLYAGVTDVYAETGEQQLMKNLTSIWNDIVTRKMYVTGACGALYLKEQYEILAKEMIKRDREGRGFTFYHYMIDLTGGPCIYKRISGCGSGTEYMAVTPWGDLYPCHQFVGDPKYLLGDIWKGVTNTAVRDEFKHCNAYARKECQDCWAKLYCSGGCAANSYHATGSITGVYEYGCELFKKRMECAIMIKVAENQELAAKGIEVPIELGSTCNACADGEACE